MEPVDGNAIGGPAARGVRRRDDDGDERLRALRRGRRGGRAGGLPPGAGTVVRCRACDSVLMVFVDVRGTYSVDLEGLAALERPEG